MERVLLYPEFAFTESMKQKISKIEEARDTGNFFYNGWPAKWRKELDNIIFQVVKQVGNSYILEEATARELVSDTSYRMSRNKMQNAQFVVLLWWSKMRLEMDAPHLFTSLSCRPAYRYLITKAYQIEG